MAPPNEEREMTNRQRSLVDDCFEEGQYESGMAVLDQLRSSSFKPPPYVSLNAIPDPDLTAFDSDHIRQLLYIALFPPPLPANDQTTQQAQFPPTPVKGSPTKHKLTLSKASLSPSVVESETAQRILFSFLATNSPASLFRALPRYPLHDAADTDLLPESSRNGHDEDSLIARESLCLRDCKNCWAILKQGFIQRKKLLPQNSRQKRERGAYDLEDAVLDQGYDTPAVVAEHAWPILQWLLSLFEKDELLKSQKSGERFSLLLLSQIPPPRGGTGPRWEAGAPLDIVFHSIKQEDRERREMAIRLLTLLINLTLSGFFDGPMFAATLTTRLYTSSPQIVQNLMEGLPKTIPVLTFKISVCQKFLSSSSSLNGGTKPRPRPLLRRGSRRDSGAMSSTTDIDVARTGSSLSSRPAIAMCSEVFQLLSGDHKSQTSASAPPVLTIKYALLVSYAQLQGLLPPEESDGDWKDALVNGGLKHVIDTSFPSDSTYHTALAIITHLWLAT
ncbi:hypothetical protein JVT61DRAFT_13843 [Boletus reticuloceps]|uniref:Uncharacterized protein n=1 Tax=Boletus reticuloceps TaxID=495285 RepID=A0A8I2YS91_9AGAM|nr:hypothetical protein JVT61DRAFT_13843 [Boletus reticuloceps]